MAETLKIHLIRRLINRMTLEVMSEYSRVELETEIICLLYLDWIGDPRNMINPIVENVSMTADKLRKDRAIMHACFWFAKGD
ncbi:hypothetical protein TSUD_112410 [Trifolium subterraneum]|uniref:Uncharacterized protein n=1 Tax=Trifolium subterraneum TaxID=3900 RepID=A0A2Z6LJJ4_TRISU|nr:hypothetical protein TSUD_112410 [Trifolium subterraneum]